MKLPLISLLVCASQVASFAPPVFSAPSAGVSNEDVSSSRSRHARFAGSSDADGAWQGDVVSNLGGMIRGCSVEAVGEEPITQWKLNIDGVEADLGKFSAAIYKKIISDAKQQRFQGFRPGTIPPHLEPTYRGFTMDECARETVLEAMQQNSIRPFTDCRTDLVIEKVSIPPPALKKKGKKKKGGSKKKKMGMSSDQEDEPAEDEAPEPEPQWQTFDDMKGAIDAGWKPGQSFSFVATNVKGQKLLTGKDAEGAKPLGLNY